MGTPVKEFKGQWIENFPSGDFWLLNLDIRNSKLRGRLSIKTSKTYDISTFKNTKIIFWLEIKAIEDNGKIIGQASKAVVCSESGIVLSQQDTDSLIAKYENIKLAQYTEFTASLDNEKLVLNYTPIFQAQLLLDSNKVTKSISLKRTYSSEKSSVKHRELSWEEFKKIALEQNEGVVYRGQSDRWRLQTSFHRTGRADVISYLDIEIPEVERYINANSAHVFDINNNKSLGALLNLAQHHGYPTPLLDWTKSPFVAAFFAFESKPEKKLSDHISIFMFEEVEWTKKFGVFAPLRTPALNLSVLALPVHNNPRVMPQQSIIMYSNIDDLESYIKAWSHDTEHGHLKAFSIPVSDRKKALKDLTLMGITRGSLFPGIDGTCQQLKARHFED